MTHPHSSAHPDPITVVAIPAFADNYIWLIEDRQSQQHWLVDPGIAKPVIDYFQANGITALAGILVTHHHNDHIGGIDDLKAHFPDTLVYGLKSARVPQVTHTVEGGQQLHLSSNLILSVLSVPGHTIDHIVYFLPAEQPRLFSGDTLFAGGCGRLFEGSPAQMRASLDQLRRLADHTLVYCAHEYTASNLQFALAVEPGNASLKHRIDDVTELREKGKPTVPSQLTTERQTNPFLRWDEPSVIAAAQAQGAEDNSPDTVFTAIRAWKDKF
ncbi:hydroxyacylglutathione hydrolase [Halioxenophilus aromaticivorans]|uniref:Hydroxyacylglutathione hydrolase n=1 Tax=Halioxenophilus aromaticivorans TaxID=1306992 RepID=A0AAV3TX54_9ALTE